MKNKCNNGNTYYNFIFYLLYGACLCLTISALISQFNLYEQKQAIHTANFQLANNNEIRQLALTFDDGPHPSYTEKLLDGLKERNVKATFFVTGEHAELHPDIIKRMHDEGHIIGNHTYSHIQLTSSNREAFKKELIKTNEIIQNITNEEVEYVRPPYGSWDKKLEKELNMFPILWNVDPLDWCTANATCVAQAVINNVKENDIILMHDYYETSVEAALIAIDELTKQGYQFVTVEEILFD